MGAMGVGTPNRQSYKCGMCDFLLEPGWHADHVIPLCENGVDEERNLQALCPKCHMYKTSLEAQLRANDGDIDAVFPIPECENNDMMKMLLSLTESVNLLTSKMEHIESRLS